PVFRVNAKTVNILQDWNLYDKDREIQVSNYQSAYYSYIKFGMKTWNNYKRGVITEDSAFTLADCKIMDAIWEDDTYAIASSKGKITFNRKMMQNAGETKKYSVAIHELGHALGIDHIPKGYAVDVMNPIANTKMVLSAIDKKAYDKAYGGATYYSITYGTK
ncbi:MAG: matrixin family metalloprotease, partial [Lachnospiraceae bacterium]|nr:matrixin family metalloprotease [Lachnospiraceae bacterium]